MKFNKLFKFEFSIIFIFFGLLLSIFIAFTNYYLNFNNYKTNIQNIQNKNIEKIDKIFNHFIDNEIKAIYLLKNSKPFQAFLNDKSEENKKNVENIFLAFTSANNIYDQVRYLDKDGNEIVRINNRENCILVEKNDLQNKKDRYYFNEIKNKNGVWFSKIDLNIENGKIEVPHIPTLRIGISIHNPTFDGIIIINIKMAEFLSSIRNLEYIDFYLIDKDGYFLLHNDKYDFSRYLNPNFTIKDEFPKNYQDILKNDNTNITDDIKVKKILFDNKDGLKAIFVINQSYYEKFFDEYKKTFFTNFIIILLLTIPFVFIISIYPNRLFYKLKKLNVAIEQSDNLICITDKFKNIEYVNTAFEKASGYKRDELIGNKISVIKSGLVTQTTYTDMYEHINNGEVWVGEFINKNKNGSLYNVKSTISSIRDENNEIFSYLAVQSDITKDKQIEKELEIKNKIIIENYKLNSLNELLKNIAHHWRQPLNIISLYLATISESSEIEDIKEREEYIEEVINKINENLNFLSNTIDEFKFQSTADSKITKFMASSAVDKSIQIVKANFNDIDIDIDIKRDGEDFEIETYFDILVDILLNLYTNAQDAILLKRGNDIYSGKIIIEIKNRKIIIKDNGNGISEEIINNIFDPYFTTKFQAKGVGLSLYLDKIVVSNKLNANIYAKSIPNEGYIALEF